MIERRLLSDLIRYAVEEGKEVEFWMTVVGLERFIELRKKVCG